MTTNLFRRPRFALERWVQRGVFHQLLLMAGLIGLVAVLGGVAAWWLTPTFDRPAPAIWWSFLRLTDPGYLGDDEGTTLRVVSTVVTVLGYVLFMGSLIAIMTQWLARTIRKLESGLTPIAMANHFVILGWTNRTPEIVKTLLTAGGRVERFFARRGGANRLRIVILADEVNAERRLELRESLGEDWDEGQVFLRSGSSLQQEHLARLDLERAAVVMIPGADFALGGAELTDTRVIKTLLTLDALLRQSPADRRPHLVAELFDPRKVSIARSASSLQTEIIAGDQLICRVLAQSLRHAVVSRVLLGLLSGRDGQTVYIRSFPQLAGRPVKALSLAFPRAIVLGVVRVRDGAHAVVLDPSREVILGPEDALILVAARYAHCEPDRSQAAETAPPDRGPLPVRPPTGRRRILLLGWSSKIPTLLSELLESSIEGFDITILSKVDPKQRDRALAHLEGGERLRVEQVEGDYSLDYDLRRMDPHGFDHVLFMASGWMRSSEEADARTVLGLLVLRTLLKQHAHTPEVLVELLDPDNARILGETNEVVFVSPLTLSHLLAHVGLRPELNAVYQELISNDGVGVHLRSLSDLGIETPTVDFTDVQLAASGFRCIALGFLIASNANDEPQVHLNPARGQSWTLGKGDAVLVIE